MVVLTAGRVLPYGRDRIFDLVADVESYPDFLPTWQEATVYRRAGSVYYTEQVVRIGLMRERFRSKTILGHPKSIRVTSTDVAIRELSIHWEFESISGGGCAVQLSQRFEVHSRLFDILLQGILPRITDQTIAAFENRAHTLYAPNAS